MLEGAYTVNRLYYLFWVEFLNVFFYGPPTYSERYLSSVVRDAAACKFFDGLSPVGQNPIGPTLVTKAWAGTYHVPLFNPFPPIMVFIFLSQASMTATTIATSVIRLTTR